MEKEDLGKKEESKESSTAVANDVPMPSFDPGYIINNEFKIVEKLDEGGFGQVFKVENMKNGKNFAIKIESSSMEGGSAIKLEMDVLTTLCDLKTPHFPQFYHAGRKPGYQYVVMELLGANLKTLRSKAANPDVLSTSTWSRIGIQCLYIIKLFHDAGFVHRDIKPSNFAMGNTTEENGLNGRLIYLLDFGLARRFILKKVVTKPPEPRKPAMRTGSTNKGRTRASAIKKKTSMTALSIEHSEVPGETRIEYKFRKPRINAEFRGTQRYASPNAHALTELGRADDLYSLLYLIIEMYQPLKWSTSTDGEEIKTMKMFLPPEELCGKHEELIRVVHNLNTCNYYSRPAYELFYEVLVSIMNKANAKMYDPYDWEKEDEEEYDKWIKLKQAKKVTYQWEQGMEFFKKDPWEPSRLVNHNITRTENSKEEKSQKNVGTPVTTPTKESREYSKEGRSKENVVHTPTKSVATPIMDKKKEERSRDTDEKPAARTTRKERPDRSMATNRSGKSRNAGLKKEEAEQTRGGGGSAKRDDVVRKKETTKLTHTLTKILKQSRRKISKK